MTIDQLMAVHRAEPFRPYYIRLQDGRRLRIRRRENLGRSPEGELVAVCPGGERIEIIHVKAIAGIETGTRRRRTKLRTRRRAV